MTILSVFKLLNIIENILCVYRNYSSFSQNVKYLVKFRTVVECGLILFFLESAIEHVCLYQKGALQFTFSLCYGLFVVMNSLAAIILSIHHSKHYRDLISSLDAIHKLCSKNSMYKLIAKKHKKKIYIQVSLSLLIISGLQFLYIYDNFSTYYDNYIMVFIGLYGTILEYRFFWESIVFYELIDILVMLMTYLNKSISTATYYLSTNNDRTENDEECDGIKNKLEIWGEISRLLGVSCERLQDCFGAQISLSLCTIDVFYIIFLYQALLYFIKQEREWQERTHTFLLALSLFTMITFLILVGGQRVKNEADMLNMNLSSLYNLLLSVPAREDWNECARTARALSRRLRAAPLRAGLQRALPLRAALLVDMLAVVVNYTIVLLQFNHVI